MLQLTYGEWYARGKELYGDDISKWEFKCPVCGYIQKPEDFIVYKSKGAQLFTGYQSCIGRYNGKAEDPNLPGCQFSTSEQPQNAQVTLEYAPGHTMLVMEFGE